MKNIIPKIWLYVQGRKEDEMQEWDMKLICKVLLEYIQCHCSHLHIQKEVLRNQCYLKCFALWEGTSQIQY